MIDFNLDWVQILTFVVAILLPLLVGLVTKVVTSPGTKAILLALLAAAAGLLSELVTALTTGATYDLGAALVTWLGIFIVAVATHFGLWKPTGVSVAAQSTFGGELPPVEPTDTRQIYRDRLSDE